MGYSTPPSNEAKNVILTSLTSVSSTMDEAYLGVEIEYQQGQRFKYVFNSTTTTVASIATYPAFFLETTANNGATITTTHDGELGRNFAGILTTAQAAGSNYHWIQTAGYVPSGAVSTSVAAAGDSLTCLEAGKLGRFPVQATSTSIGGVTPDLVIYPIIATSSESATGGLADYVLHGRGK